MNRVGRLFWLIVLLVFPASFALAQTVADTSGSSTLQWLAGTASLAITGAAPLLTLFIGKHLRIANTGALNAMLADAASRAAGLAVHEIMISGARLDSVTRNHPALVKAVAYVNSAFPDAIAALGATQEQVAKLVLGEFGKLLAVPVQTTNPIKS